MSAESASLNDADFPKNLLSTEKLDLSGVVAGVEEHDGVLEFKLEPHGKVAHMELEQRHKLAVDPEYIHQQELSAEFFFLFIIGIQILIYVLYKKYPERFKEVTFVLLWLYPLVLLHRDQHPVTLGFIAVWILWSLRTGFLMHLALAKPLAPTTPELVYGWFLKTHSICYYSAGATVYIFFLVPGLGILMLFFALYFGVLGRDCAEICATRISNTIGYTKYETAPENICALCNIELRQTLELMLGETTEDEQPNVIQLQCKHEFHEKCIRGWTIVGKKDICPFCFEKVDMRILIPDSPWNSKRLSLLWVKLLGLIRFLLVWNPLVTYSAMILLKLFHFAPLRDQSGKPVF